MTPRDWEQGIFATKDTYPHFSPASCCVTGSIQPDYVALGRPSRRTVEYDCEGLGRDALSGRRLQCLATRPGEKSGLSNNKVNEFA